MRKLTQLLGRAFGSPKPESVPAASPPTLLAPARVVPQRFVVVDAEGHPTAFYSSEIHGVSIPANARPLTEAQYRRWHEGHCANPMKRHRLVGSEMVEHVEPPKALEEN